MKRNVRLHCPKCPPFKTPSLSLDKLTGLFHCFRCNYSGKTKGQFRMDMLNEFVQSTPDNIKFPENYEHLDPYNPRTLKEKFALKYLFNRHITPEQILRYKIGFCATGQYENRVIIPFFLGEELKYFVARSILPNAPRKYLNPPVPKGAFLFKTFVGKVAVAAVVEGVFDALNVESEMPTIALLGKSPTQAQIDKISSYTDRVLLMLDSDAHRDALELEQKLAYYVPVQKVLLKSGDPGSLSKGKLHELLSPMS